MAPRVPDGAVVVGVEEIEERPLAMANLVQTVVCPQPDVL